MKYNKNLNNKKSILSYKRYNDDDYENGSNFN